MLYFDMPTHLPVPPDRRRYWDGAVAGYNNPSLAAAIEALSNKAPAGRVRILSIGTGTVQRPRRPPAVALRDGRFVGREPQGLLRDGQKLAGAILDDPPDAASFAAHVALGGELPDGGAPITDGPLIRLNPTIRPVWKGRQWSWGAAFSEEQWLRLAGTDMDAVDDDEVALIRALAEAWLRDAAPNQPVRANERLEAEIGHDTFGAGMKAASTWLQGS